MREEGWTGVLKREERGRGWRVRRHPPETVARCKHATMALAKARERERAREREMELSRLFYCASPRVAAAAPVTHGAAPPTAPSALAACLLVARRGGGRQRKGAPRTRVRFRRHHPLNPFPHLPAAAAPAAPPPPAAALEGRGGEGGLAAGASGRFRARALSALARPRPPSPALKLTSTPRRRRPTHPSCRRTHPSTGRRCENRLATPSRRRRRASRAHSPTRRCGVRGSKRGGVRWSESVRARARAGRARSTRAAPLAFSFRSPSLPRPPRQPPPPPTLDTHPPAAADDAAPPRPPAAAPEAAWRSLREAGPSSWAKQVEAGGREGRGGRDGWAPARQGRVRRRGGGRAPRHHAAAPRPLTPAQQRAPRDAPHASGAAAGRVAPSAPSAGLARAADLPPRPRPPAHPAGPWRRRQRVGSGPWREGVGDEEGVESCVRERRPLATPSSRPPPSPFAPSVIQSRLGDSARHRARPGPRQAGHRAAATRQRRRARRRARHRRRHS